MNGIVIRDLTKAFGDRILFKNLTMTLPIGFSCLVGPSGCGKTTFGRILAGFEKPTEGSVSGIVGRPAVLFQEHRLLPSFSALRNVSCVTAGKPAGADGAARELLTSLGFSPEDTEKKPDALSGGMRQRVALARLMLFASENPGNFAVLDEPFRGLDPAMKETAADLLRDRLSDRAVLLITHDRSDAALTRGDFLPLFDG